MYGITVKKQCYTNGTNVNRKKQCVYRTQSDS